MTDSPTPQGFQPSESNRESRGLFFVLDGGDGSGKSTQASRLHRFLVEERNRDACHLRDPGSVVVPGGVLKARPLTPLAEAVRGLLLDPVNERMGLRTEVLLYMAARAQLVEEAILPTLAAGQDVVCERYLLSTLIYQGVAAGEALDSIRKIGQYATREVVPDLTLLLDVSLEVAQARIGGDRDRIEARSDAYHSRVREGFARAEELVPDWRLCRISTEGSPEAVFESIRKAVDDVL